MKVLQIGDTESASRRFSGYDLNSALRNRHIEAEQSVFWKNLQDNHISEISPNLSQRESLRDYLTKINSLYSTNALFYPFSYGLFFDQQFLSSDVIHLHLIHNYFFDISHLPIISRVKPVVWTLHDLWPIQGHCVHPLQCERWKTGCGDCPDLALSFGIQQDTSALNYEYKKLVFSNCEMDLIVASQWMYDRIQCSGFFPKSEIHLIEFGLDLSIFKPLDNHLAIRNKLGIPEKNVVIAFRANQWIYKGFHYIKECLGRLSTEVPVTLIVFDEKGLLTEFEDRFQIIEMSWVIDEVELVKIYNAADIFLMPSVAESFGMMSIEAMACEKPVIVMDQTALPEVIKPEESGCIVVRQGDVEGLTLALEKLISDPAMRIEIGKRSRMVAQKYYDYSDYVTKTQKVYESALRRKKEDSRAKEIVEQLQKHVAKDTPPSPVFPLGNVINVFPEAPSEKNKFDSISISIREFQLIKKVLWLERTAFIQFIIHKILKPIVKFFKATPRR